MTWTLAGTLRRWAAETPDRPMLTGQGSDGKPATRTWREMDERSSRLANALAADGVEAGDRIAFLDKNGLAYYDALFAGAKLNAVDVAVNWRLAAPEMAQVINDAEAKVLFVGPEFVTHLELFASDIPSVRRVVLIESDTAGDATGDATDADGRVGLEDWMASQPATDPGAQATGGDVAYQLYTSGTTGLPKGVMLTNDNLGGMMPGFAVELGIDRDSVNLAAMPLFHIGGSGWSLVGITAGCHTVLTREVDPALVLRTVEELRVTHAFLVPAVLQFMLAVPGVEERDLSSLRMVAYGASPISEDVLRRCLQTFGCEFAQLYGMTETTGAITILRPQDHAFPPRLRSCGVPFAHVELRIVDPETGADCPAGQVGELWTRSSQNMAGYWRKPDETAKTVNSEGWLRTGDAGYLDADGFVYLHDRIKDMIVSGAENIYPAEVENVLMSHPGVADVAVIGVPDEKWGETVKAIVVPEPSGAPEPADLIAYARERLAHYKCPTSVDFADALPRNPSGKILKRELRAPYWASADRNIG